MNTVVDFAVLTAIITGVVQGVKIALGDRFSQFMPLVADVLGVAAAIFFIDSTPSSIATGLLAGLAASGLYSQVRTAAGK